MDNKHQELAKRAMDCDGWRWMEGMLCIWPNGNEFRVGQVNTCEATGLTYPSNGWGDDYPDLRSGHPDLHDPATRGCLLELVRKSLDLFGVSTHYILKPPTMCWQVINPVEVYAYSAAKRELEFTECQARELSNLLEIEALVVALENAGDE